MYEDNQSTIALLKNPVHQSRTKHIDVKYHFIRQCVDQKLIKVVYCPTNDMLADGLTKTLGGQKFRDFASNILGSI